MKLIYWILKRNFPILVLSLFFLAFSISYLVRSTLIQIFTEGNSPYPAFALVGNKGRMDTEAETTHKSSIAPDSIDELVEGNLIRGSAVFISTTKKDGKGETPPIQHDPKLDSIIVTGTVSGNQSFARVVLKEKDKEESEEYRVGQKLGEYKILRINAHSITLGGENFSFNVEIGETIGTAYEKQKPSEINPNPIPDETAIQHNTVFSRTDMERILKDTGEIYKARFAPNLVNGKIEGMKIYEVNAKHIFYQLGARNGDIIKRVNGMPLGETEKMLEIWAAVKVSPKIQVDLDRKGQTHTYTFLVRN